MIDTVNNPQHFIQRYILDVLRHTEYARFRDLRPPKVDSNAFSYHLGQLKRQGLVVKTDADYTLSRQGIAYIDRVSRLDTRPRIQPKIMTIVAIYNEHDEVFMYPKKTQPMIGLLTMPAGMLHLEDDTIEAAARRELEEKIGLKADLLEHAGDCYMGVRSEGITLMNALMHVFTTHIAEKDVARPDDFWWLEGARWCDSTVPREHYAPATQNILTALGTRRPGQRFFEEYVVEW